ncbi:hypothetical protein JW721_02470 [Candidatus Micrarchaeota archaeon]|nr:hypothetical protein [Candidatus Micrarchaeota archaeon]
MLKKILKGIESGCSSPEELAKYAGVEVDSLPGYIDTLVVQGYLAPAGCSGGCSSCGGCPSAKEEADSGVLYMTEKGKKLVSSDEGKDE